MNNRDKVRRLESELSQKKRNRKIIRWAMFLLFATLIIVFSVLFKNSKEIVIIGEYVPVELEKYNYGYLTGIIFSVFGLIFSIVLLVIDYLFCRFGTVEANGHYVTVFKKYTGNVVYVNGEFNNKFHMISIKLFYNVKLPNDVTVKITFLWPPLRLAHFSFTDGTPSIEL
jgi:hypothetical protein